MIAGPPLLIIIQGAPASGKTTLAHKLKSDLGIGLIVADDVKEFFYDALGVQTTEWTKELGRSLKPYLYSIAELALSNNCSIIYESAFWAEYAKIDMAKLLEKTEAHAIELYCHAPEDVRRERFDSRIVRGSRHPGHASNVGDVLPDVALYATIGVCDVVDIDTTQFDDEAYNKLLMSLKSLLNDKTGVLHETTN